MNDISKIAISLMDRLNKKFKCHATVTWCEGDGTIWFHIPTGGEAAASHGKFCGADTAGRIRIGSVHPEMDESGGLSPLSLKEWYEVMYAS